MMLDFPVPSSPHRHIRTSRNVSNVSGIFLPLRNEPVAIASCHARCQGVAINVLGVGTIMVLS